MGPNSLMPTTKVQAGIGVGLLANVIIGILQNRFNINLTGDEASLITWVLTMAAAYITPHIPPPPPTGGP